MSRIIPNYSVNIGTISQPVANAFAALGPQPVVTDPMGNLNLQYTIYENAACYAANLAPIGGTLIPIIMTQNLLTTMITLVAADPSNNAAAAWFANTTTAG